MRGGMTTMLEDAVAKCRAGDDLRAAECSASRRCGRSDAELPLSRAHPGTARSSPARSPRRRAAEVARRIEYLGLVPVDTVTRRSAAAGAAAPSALFNKRRRPRT